MVDPEELGYSELTDSGMDEHEFLTIIFQQFYDGNPLLGLPTPTISNFQIIETLIPENSSDRKTVRLSYTVKELDTTTGEYQLTYETDFLDFHKSSGKWEPLIPDLKSFLYQ
ncbi:hypothetical protein [Endozoicomonas sp. Mp262]|uniref:hypothetical protein n=1 Tax=Endozoicomonas sp. Mp262 TaxID=2919499 RepID=UPI0021E04B19